MSMSPGAPGSDLGALLIDPGDTHEYYTFLPITPGSTDTDISFGEIGSRGGHRDSAVDVGARRARPEFFRRPNPADRYVRISAAT